MLEAAACELPLVVTNVNGVPEIVGDGEGGIIVAREAAAVARALAELAGDPVLRARMGRAARSRVRHHTPLRSVEATVALYRRLLPQDLADALAPRGSSAGDSESA